MTPHNHLERIAPFLVFLYFFSPASIILVLLAASLESCLLCNASQNTGRIFLTPALEWFSIQLPISPVHGGLLTSDPWPHLAANLVPSPGPVFSCLQLASELTAADSHLLLSHWNWGLFCRRSATFTTCYISYFNTTMTFISIFFAVYVLRASAMGLSYTNTSSI